MPFVLPYYRCQWVHLINPNETSAENAKRLGVSRSTAARAAKEAGITLPTSRDLKIRWWSKIDRDKSVGDNAKALNRPYHSVSYAMRAMGYRQLAGKGGLYSEGLYRRATIQNLLHQRVPRSASELHRAAIDELGYEISQRCVFRHLDFLLGHEIASCVRHPDTKYHTGYVRGSNWAYQDPYEHIADSDASDE